METATACRYDGEFLFVQIMSSLTVLIITSTLCALQCFNSGRLNVLVARLRGYQHFSSVILPLFGRSNEMFTFLTMLI